MRYSLIMKLSFLISVIGCHHDKEPSVLIPEGGYDFPKTFTAKDTLIYIYPIKETIAPNDSFKVATYTAFLYKSFNEPNLSLSPAKNPVYRLIYQPGFTRYSAILTLRDQKIVVKELESGYAVPYTEKERLNAQELEHLHLFEMYFPIDRYVGQKWLRKYLDSLIKIYPNLLNPNYYRSLIIKASTYGTKAFTYKEREISLTKEKYNYFLNLINQSGYWKLRPFEINCIGEVTHPSGYILEAATQSKYNFVEYMECPNDTSSFAQAIDELVKYTKIKENEKRWHELIRIEGQFN